MAQGYKVFNENVNIKGSAAECIKVFTDAVNHAVTIMKKCGQCGAEFYQNKRFVIHMRTHVPKIVCDICDKAVGRSRVQLFSHKVKHHTVTNHNYQP